MTYLILAVSVALCAAAVVWARWEIRHAIPEAALVGDWEPCGADGRRRW